MGWGFAGRSPSARFSGNTAFGGYHMDQHCDSDRRHPPAIEKPKACGPDKAVDSAPDVVDPTDGALEQDADRQRQQVMGAPNANAGMPAV